MSIYIGLGKYSNNGAEGLIDGSFHYQKIS